MKQKTFKNHIKKLAYPFLAILLISGNVFAKGLKEDQRPRLSKEEAKADAERIAGRIYLLVLKYLTAEEKNTLHSIFIKGLKRDAAKLLGKEN